MSENQDFSHLVPITDKPHDAFTKAYLSNEKAASRFIATYFPALQKTIKHVALTNKSFVRQDLKQLHSDLVFDLQLNDHTPGYAYVLCEAESGKPDPYMIFRLANYVEALVKSYMKMNSPSKQWPQVYTALLYHGTKSPYPYQEHVVKYIDMFQNFVLIDLTSMSNTTIETHQEIALLEKLLKYSRHKDLLARLEKIIAQEIQSGRLEITLDHLSIEKRMQISMYILAILDKQRYPEKESLNLLQNILQLNNDHMISVAKVIEQRAEKRGIQLGEKRGEKRGIQLGEKRGRQAGIFQTAKNMLSKGLDINLIQELTGLNTDQLKTL